MSTAISRSAETRLARRAARGSSRAIEAIFERYHQELYRYCAGIVGNSADAQDAVQNTMIKVLRALPGERREIDLKPWLYRIAHNEAIEIVRRRVSQSEVDAGSLRPAASAADEVLAREDLRRILADLADLPARQRGALVMRELAGLDFEQIGAALGSSAASARQTLYEARLGLRAMGEGREMDCGAAMRAISDGDRRRLRGRRLRAHLRACEECQAFAGEIERRVGELALVSPLPAAAAAGILQGVAGGGGGAAVAGTAGAAAGKGVISAAAIKAAAAVGVVVAIGVTAADRGGLVDLGPGAPTSPAPKAASPRAGSGSEAAAGAPPTRTRSRGGRVGGAAAAGAAPTLSPERVADRAPKAARPGRQQHTGGDAQPSEETAPAAEPEEASPPAPTDPGRHLGQGKRQEVRHGAAVGSKGKSAFAPGQAKTPTAKATQPPTPAAEPSGPGPQVPEAAPEHLPPEHGQGTRSEAAAGPPAAEHAEATPPAATGATGAEPPSQPPGRAGAIPEGS